LFLLVIHPWQHLMGPLGGVLMTWESGLRGPTLARTLNEHRPLCLCDHLRTTTRPDLTSTRLARDLPHISQLHHNPLQGLPEACDHRRTPLRPNEAQPRIIYNALLGLLLLFRSLERKKKVTQRTLSRTKYSCLSRWFWWVGRPKLRVNLLIIQIQAKLKARGDVLV
jgi:hypothetical protein